MRGDQLARQWQVIRVIEASPNGLPVSEIANREETGIRTIYRDLEAYRAHAHAKAQSALRKIFRLLLPFLDIFLTPSHSIRKTVKKFSAIPLLRSWWLGVRWSFWHKCQKIIKLPDGSLVITFRVAGLDEIKRRVLSFGPEAFLPEPEKFKEMVRKDLSRNLAKHAKRPSSVKLLREMRAV